METPSWTWNWDRFQADFDHSITAAEKHVLAQVGILVIHMAATFIGMVFLNTLGWISEIFFLIFLLTSPHTIFHERFPHRGWAMVTAVVVEIIGFVFVWGRITLVQYACWSGRGCI
jgi:hypothetical protein